MTLKLKMSSKFKFTRITLENARNILKKGDTIVYARLESNFNDNIHILNKNDEIKKNFLVLGHRYQITANIQFHDSSSYKGKFYYATLYNLNTGVKLSDNIGLDAFDKIEEI
jgi:hypothetical protein